MCCFGVSWSEHNYTRELKNPHEQHEVAMVVPFVNIDIFKVDHTIRMLGIGIDTRWIYFIASIL